MKKLKGYIFSRQFMGEKIQQNIQNITIRNFCEKNNFFYTLSSAEYAMEDSYMILKSMISNAKQFNGIIAYSLFQLPKDLEMRTNFLEQMIKKKIFFVSAIEEIFIKNKYDIEEMNKLWKIKEILQYCPKNI